MTAKSDRTARFAAAGLVAVLAAGCTLAAGNRTEWSCGGETLVAVRAAGQAAPLTVEWRDRTWRLERAPSSSGARYASADAEYWVRDGQLAWTVKGGYGWLCERAA